jgi:transcriptional regulator with XRE-family HTH domain
MAKMSPDDKPFFVELGKRIAILRRDQNMSQQQLADALGIPQQTLGHYEVGRSKLSAAMLPVLSDLFNVPVDVLVGRNTATLRAGKRGPPSQLERTICRINELPKAKQKFVLEMLETVLGQTNSE